MRTAFARSAFCRRAFRPKRPRCSAFCGTCRTARTCSAVRSVSLAHVRALLGDAASVHLDHDLAFEADLRPWARPGYGTLYAFRSDPESLGEPIPPGNFDVSGLTGEWMAELLLDVVASHAVVHTDRAHVAIAAALLGRETHVYATAYHKVRGIHEHSLAGRANVQFHERHGTLAHPAAAAAMTRATPCGAGAPTRSWACAPPRRSHERSRRLGPREERGGCDRSVRAPSRRAARSSRRRRQRIDGRHPSRFSPRSSPKACR